MHVHHCHICDFCAVRRQQQALYDETSSMSIHSRLYYFLSLVCYYLRSIIILIILILFYRIEPNEMQTRPIKKCSWHASAIYYINRNILLWQYTWSSRKHHHFSSVMLVKNVLIGQGHRLMPYVWFVVKRTVTLR